MSGYILLAGGAEFGGRMASPDQRAIYLAGGSGVPVRIIPAAAAPDNNHIHAGNNGLRWFKGLGAKDVTSLELVDRASADREDIVAELRNARLFYLLGGFPTHLYSSLAGSRGWQAVLDAYQEGAVIAGSSAGAMVLCSHFFDPYTREVMEGLNLVPNACVLPHYTSFGRHWVKRLQATLPQAMLPQIAMIGIEEQTAAINDGEQGRWTVYGKGRVTLIRGDTKRVYARGEGFELV